MKLPKLWKKDFEQNPRVCGAENGEGILYVCTRRQANGGSYGDSSYRPAVELYGHLAPSLKMRLAPCLKMCLALSLKIQCDEIAYKQTNRVNLIIYNIFSVAYKQKRVNQNRVNRELPVLCFTVFVFCFSPWMQGELCTTSHTSHPELNWNDCFMNTALRTAHIAEI